MKICEGKSKEKVHINPKVNGGDVVRLICKGTLYFVGNSVSVPRLSLYNISDGRLWSSVSTFSNEKFELVKDVCLTIDHTKDS